MAFTTRHNGFAITLLTKDNIFNLFVGGRIAHLTTANVLPPILFSVKKRKNTPLKKKSFLEYSEFS